MLSGRRQFVPALRIGWLSLVTFLGLSLTGPAANAQTFTQACTRQSAPVLRRSGVNLLTDGQPSFLVLVSYFDAMRASEATLERDFAFLKSKGVDGIRIFPLWVYGTQTPDATLLDADGRIRSDERWRHFDSILRKAGACGFVVDVTFNREHLDKASEFSVEEFQAGIVEVASRLHAAQRSPHVFMDLQNERGHPDAPAMQLTNVEVRRLRDAVKSADPSRLVMVSTQGGARKSLSLASRAELDVIAFHELQKPGWHDNTAAHGPEIEGGRRPCLSAGDGPRSGSRGPMSKGHAGGEPVRSSHAPCEGGRCRGLDSTYGGRIPTRRRAVSNQDPLVPARDRFPRHFEVEPSHENTKHKSSSGISVFPRVHDDMEFQQSSELRAQQHAKSLQGLLSRFRAFVALFFVRSTGYSENSFASSTHSPFGASCWYARQCARASPDRSSFSSVIAR